MKTRQTKSLEDYGVSRIDDDINCTHAWRISLSRNGRRFVRNFTDRKHGDGQQALHAARIYRDQILRENPPISRKEFCSIRRSNNKSGTTGVCSYSKRYERRDGSINEKWYWEASWPNRVGESTRKLFSVDRYGEEKARQMAIRTRQEALASLSGVFWVSERGVVPSDHISPLDP